MNGAAADAREGDSRPAASIDANTAATTRAERCMPGLYLRRERADPAQKAAREFRNAGCCARVNGDRSACGVDDDAEGLPRDLRLSDERRRQRSHAGAAGS